MNAKSRIGGILTLGDADAGLLEGVNELFSENGLSLGGKRAVGNRFYVESAKGKSVLAGIAESVAGARS